MKVAALATMVLTLSLLLMVPHPNRAARIDSSAKLANGSGPTFTKFDCPGAGTGALQGTGGISINKAGAITGFCVLSGSGDIAHGFMRAAGGAVTVFDAPGAGTAKHEGTFPTSINTGGVITGMFSDANSVYHGFVGAAGGAITPFDAPGERCSSSMRPPSPPSSTAAFDFRSWNALPAFVWASLKPSPNK
jgi:hypothetical protein